MSKSGKSRHVLAARRMTVGLAAVAVALFVLGCGAEPEQGVGAQTSPATEEAPQVASPSPQAERGWYHNWDEGLEAAKNEGKPVVVDFHADWCRYCRAMDEGTFRAPEVMNTLASDWVAIKVDVEDVKTEGTFKQKKWTYKDLAQALGIRGLPSYLFIDAQGEPVQIVSGYFPAEKFERMLDYMKKGLYKQEVSLQNYLDSKS